TLARFGRNIRQYLQQPVDGRAALKRKARRPHLIQHGRQRRRNILACTFNQQRCSGWRKRLRKYWWWRQRLQQLHGQRDWRWFIASRLALAHGRRVGEGRSAQAQNRHTGLRLITFFRTGLTLDGCQHHAVPSVGILSRAVIATDDQSIFRSGHADIEKPPVLLFGFALYLIFKPAHGGIGEVLASSPKVAGDRVALELERQEVRNV